MTKSQKILVTGGAGFIGTNLCNELIRRGHEVISCDLYNTKKENYVRCDVREYRQLERVFEKWNFDYVYHLGAEYGRWNGEDHYENLWATNVIGTKHMIRLQEKLKFRMIFFSSAEVYGDYEEVMSEDVMEKNPIRDTYQMNYAITKWAGELMCMNSAKMFDTETVRVRRVNCYGPGEHYTPYRGLIPKFIYNNAFYSKPYVVYNGHKRIIDYIDDTARTFANIVDNFIPGEVYNVAGKPEWEKDIKEYSDLILNAVERDDSIVTYKEAEPFTTKIKSIDCSKAIKDLKHDPKVPPEEGIKRTVEWMRWYYRIGD